MSDTSPTSPLLPRALAYPLVVGLPMIGLVLVLHVGAKLPAPTVVWSAPIDETAGLTADAIVLRLDRLLAQIVVILVLSRLIGRSLRRVGQPFVVGEMLAGIVLGPSVLGLLAPGAYAALFPAGSVRFLEAVSHLGLILFMFLVGLELRPEELRGRGNAAALVSHASIVMPLFFGATLALFLYPRLGSSGVAFSGFALFLGAAISVTAFPVLARILGERGLRGTRLGSLAIACAAVDDVTAWCVLAIVVAVAREGTSAAELTLTLVGTAAYAVAMLVLGRRRLAWMADRYRDAGRVTHDLLAVIVVVALGSAWITQRLGIHALFGAFIAGVIMPKSELFVRGVARPFEDVMVVVLLPLFFAATGIRTSLDSMNASGMWTMFLMILCIAVVGKLGGSTLAARVSGLTWTESLSLGALMNTRGLMALVILQVGAEIGVVSPPLFVMIVLTSVMTTMMTTPIMALLDPRRQGEGLEPHVVTTGDCEAYDIVS
jgi:Kef-type K+ transport system membrane component KefB